MTTENLVTDLETILAAKRSHLNERKSRTPIDAIRALASMQKRPRSILNTVTDGSYVSIIGQIRHLLSDTGHLADNYDPVSLALRYMREGLDAVAVFTDDTLYQQGLDDLALVARAVNLPVISQDYVLDEYHVVESRAAGASALILSASVLDEKTLRNLVSATQRNRMTAIVQVTNEDHLDYALTLSPHAVALCSPDERTVMDVRLFENMRKRIPSHVRTLSTYVLHTPEDVDAVLSMNVDALVVDEALWSKDELGRRLMHLVKEDPTHRTP